MMALSNFASVLLSLCLFSGLTTVTAQNPVTGVNANGSPFYYRSNFTLQVTLSAQTDVTQVVLTLLEGDVESVCPLLAFPFRVSVTNGTVNNISLSVPLCVPENSNYKVRVSVEATNLYADSNTFSIAQSTESCRPGEYNAITGTEPGCLPCPIGTYSAGTGSYSCSNCSAGFTTSFRGATSSQACNTTIVPANQGYLKFDATYFYHSNAGGTLIMAHEHKTIEECMQLCTQSPGCKAFDAGGDEGTFFFAGDPLPGLSQAQGRETYQMGDCFLSYDDIGTIKEGDVGMTTQLDLYQKVDAQRVKDIFFRKTPDCYIHESNDGGAYKDEHSPEACAQLCLNDASCVSFDAGTVRAGAPGSGLRWQPAIDDCFLSYKTRANVSNSDFVCEQSAGLDYFELIVPKYLEIDTNFQNIGAWSRAYRHELPNNAAWQQWYPALSAWYNSTYNCWRGGTNINTCFTQNNPYNFPRWTVRGPVPSVSCPVSWSYDDAVKSLYSWMTTRDNFATAVKTALVQQLNLSPAAAAKVFVRVEEGTDAQGNPSSSPKTVAVINLGSISADNTYGNQITNSSSGQSMTIAGSSYTVRRKSPLRCAAGYASQSGYAPGCNICPPDSFSNWANTDCLPCPLGTVSDAGSATTGQKACRPIEDTSAIRFGAFRVGYEWFGFYEFNQNRGRGQIRFRVTEAAINQDDPNAIDLTVYTSVHHGNDCNASLGCRDPGLSEYFMTGTVSGTNLYLDPAAWGAITDRSFDRFTISGPIGVFNRNNVLTASIVTGTANNQGTATLYERCHSADESGTFSPGNKFVGTYSCYRRGTNMTITGTGNDPCQSALEGNLPEVDVRRIELLVTRVDESSGTIQASVNFDYENGEGNYHVSGTYEPSTGQVTFDAGGGAWNSPHPGNIPARQISGRLTDDKEFFKAQYNSNPNCQCNGTQINGQGATCSATWSLFPNFLEPWCFVSSECPDSIAVPGYIGTFYARCNVDRADYSSTTNVYQTCTDVTMARICSAGSPNCPIGWTSDPVQDRCMRKSSSFSDNTTKTFADASAFCEAQNASLVSIHSLTEQRFISQPGYPNGLTGTGGQQSPIWIGLNATTRDDAGDTVLEWTDGTHYGHYTRLPSQQVNTTGCGAVLPNNLWSIGDCNQQYPFVCWKPSLGVVPDECACTGDVDENDMGGTCNFWSGRSNPAWCFVSIHCTRGVNTDSGRRANCFNGLAASTTPTPTTSEMTTNADIGCAEGSYQRPVNGQSQCFTCTVASDCQDGEYLDGTCSTYTTPVCRQIPNGFFLNNVTNSLEECDIRCATCVASSISLCTSCAAGSPLYLEPEVDGNVGACVSDCQNRGFFKDNTTQRCVPCSDPGGAAVQSQCTEYRDTVCQAAGDGCPSGSGPLGQSRCCSNCISGVTYSSQDSNPSNGYFCQPVTQCLAGYEEDRAPNQNLDRTCRLCSTGFFSTNSSACSPLSNCPAGTFIQPGADQASTPPYSDRNCVQCGPETFSTGTNSARCTDATICNPGQQELRGLTSVRDRRCTDCPSGQFSTGGPACSDYSICRAGTFVATSPSASVDRSCQQCGSGKFSSGINADSCTDFSSVCRAGFGFTRAGSSSNDIRCNSRCQRGSTYNDGSFLNCQDLQDCQPGFYIANGDTTTRDRDCQPCPSGRFSTTTNADSCTEATVCGINKEVDDELTPSSDRTCKDCDVGYQSFGNNAECLVASSSESEDSSSSSILLPVIIVVVLIIIIALVAAVVVVLKAKAAASNAHDTRLAFENPTYDTTDDVTYGGAPHYSLDDDEAYQEPEVLEAAGYMDLPGAGAENDDGSPGYMDVAPNVDDDDDDDDDI